MYHRRRLPHFHPDPISEAYLFVTWRLEGLLPRSHPKFWAAPPEVMTPGEAFVKHDRVLDKAAYGPRWLEDARIAEIVKNALLYGETGREFYHLRAWSILPNHVHLLLQPRTPMPAITRWLKGSTARQANKMLSRTGKPFWQDESFDHRVRDPFQLERIARYVEYNPVAAGLVPLPEMWPWSSVRWAGGSACPTRSTNDD